MRTMRMNDEQYIMMTKRHWDFLYSKQWGRGGMHDKQTNKKW